MVRKLFLTFILAFMTAGASAAGVNDFKEVCDSLTMLLEKRTSVKSAVKIKKVSANGKLLNISFTEDIGDYPWTREDIKWFRDEIKRRLPAIYSGCSIGELKCLRRDLYEYVTPVRGNDGSPAESRYLVPDHRYDSRPLVECTDRERYGKGLSGRHIALWQSHGRYYEQKLGRWEWQRATIFETVEDLYTQSYVVPFLVPMLENAGAVVTLPRERDFSRIEVIADNDKGFAAAEGPCNFSDSAQRIAGGYSEKGGWSDAGAGFCDVKAEYTGIDNPFTMGTARQSAQSAKGSGTKAEWTAEMPERGEYAVYVSYKTLPNSSDCASYTVHHLGGDTHFTVNQTMGGGMWVYLGTFELPQGRSTVVTLDAGIPAGCRSADKVVTADAVKIGGGMGNIARSVTGDQESEACCSGMPRFTEGARYWLQWSGFDETVWNLNEQKHDYRDDFMCRGPWVQHLTGGSRINPSEDGKGIPVDLSFAFHTDAGTKGGDTIVGTLAIYTLLKDNMRKYTDGSDRMAAREYTELVQDQIVNDIRAGFEPEWRRRQLWDRSYSESRMPNVPAMLLELLSHQNFADMKYGHDPAFRFTVSRAVYKGMLKFLSNRYGCGYVVQPLPVNSFAATFVRNPDGKLASDDGCFSVRLRWKETPDSLEPTAVASSYRIYTRIDDGGWDNGYIAETFENDGFICHDRAIEPGHRYAWKIEACNAGGRSFPSQVMSAGIPLCALEDGGRDLKSTAVLVIDNFDRVAAPTFYDSPEYAGFDNRQDSGIGYMYDCCYIGDMYEWHRVKPWMDDDCPGFGGSYTDWADRIIAGNTMDWSRRHGELIYKAGFAWCSASSLAFSDCAGLSTDIYAVDLVCGKQVSTYSGRGCSGCRSEVFPAGLQAALRDYCSHGGNLIVSGAYIATDAWGGIYPFKPDAEKEAAARKFCSEVLGYKWMSNYGSRSGVVKSCSRTLRTGDFSFNTHLNGKCYRVESPDGIVPVGSKGKCLLRYADSNVSAAVFHKAGNYRCLSLGFPIETIEDGRAAEELMDKSLKLILEQ